MIEFLTIIHIIFLINLIYIILFFSSLFYGNISKYSENKKKYTKINRMEKRIKKEILKK